MKKFAILAAFVATTLMVPAASLTWGYGAGYLYVSKPGDTEAQMAGEFEKNNTVPDGAAFVLVYLGASSAFDVGSITADDVVASIAYGYKIMDEVDSYAKTESMPYTVVEGGERDYKKNDWFGIAFYDGKKYSSVYAVTDYEHGTIGDAISPVVQITDLDGKASFSLYASSGGPVDEYDINMAGVTVPEPSVALLGLLGIGMLIKRRRA